LTSSQQLDHAEPGPPASSPRTATENAADRASDSDDLDILILGPVPPPFGGVSAHLARLVPLLQQSGFRVGVLNHFHSVDAPYVLGALRRNPINYYFAPRKADAPVFHYHHSRWLHLIAFFLGQRGRQAQYVITLHAPDIGRDLRSRLAPVRRLTRAALNRFGLVIAVNDQIRDAVRDYVDPQRLVVIPAYLTASADEAHAYDAEVEAFLRSGRVLIVAAYRVQFIPDGGEMYGLDTAAEAFVALAREHPEARLALFIAQPPTDRRGRRHLAAVEQKLLDAGIRDRAAILFDRPLLPAFGYDVVFLRPTRSEGDAVSVREALQAGVTVVASDVVGRPAGVATFATGDPEALAAAVASALGRSGPEHALPAPDDASEAEGFSAELIRLYRAQLDQARRDAT
jgi:glycosyltransferase involved in cell wall biosynthesis